MEFDKEKFKNLVHYVIWKTSGKDGFGATKLYKVLWFSEARAYVLRKRPIAGATYIREEHGPVPKLARQIRSELVAEGRISEFLIDRGKYKGWVFKSLVPPPKDFLTSEDRQDVDWWIKHIDEDHSATSISDFSHDYGWEIAKRGEELPLYSVLAERFREPSDQEIEIANVRAKKLGLH